MKKLDYLKLVIHNKLFAKKAWVITAFSIIKEDEKKYLSDPYFLRLVPQSWGYSFVDSNQELVKIDDSNPNEPLFTFKDKLSIDNTWLPNVANPIQTTVGNLLFNAICIVPAFGSKMKYLEGSISMKDIEKDIGLKLKDNVSDESKKDNISYYVDEYLIFANSLEYIGSLTQLCTYAATPKNLLAPTGIAEFKKQLLIKYEGKLHDPVELNKFEKELMDFDDAYLKDDPSNNTFVKGKIKHTARKKMFLTLGSDPGFSNDLTVSPVLNSLEEGWPTDPVQFTTMMNTLRAGSFGRGAETIKGGTTAKILLRSANNFKIIDNDCNSKLGIHRNYNIDNVKQLVGRYIITNSGYVLIDNIETAKKFIDKDIIVRSPMYCKLDGDNICKICAGVKLASQPTGIAISLTDISGTILAASMAAMHSKVLAVKHLEIAKVFS